MYGELIPNGGGDPIPLLKPTLTIGRRESCDIVLRFGSVSGQHCELILEQGWWFVKDLGSQNGTRVNGLPVTRKRLDPGDRLTISRLDYDVRYSPSENGGDDARPPEDDLFADIMGRSLMESAGLDRKKKQLQDGRVGARRSDRPRPDSAQGESTPSGDGPLSAPDAGSEEVAAESEDAPADATDGEPSPAAETLSGGAGEDLRLAPDDA